MRTGSSRLGLVVLFTRCWHDAPSGAPPSPGPPRSRDPSGKSVPQSLPGFRLSREQAAREERETSSWAAKSSSQTSASSSCYQRPSASAAPKTIHSLETVDPSMRSGSQGRSPGQLGFSSSLPRPVAAAVTALNSRGLPRGGTQLLGRLGGSVSSRRWVRLWAAGPPALVRTTRPTQSQRRGSA